MKNKDLYTKLGILSKITIVLYCMFFVITSVVISMEFSKYEKDKNQINAEINDFNSALSYYGKDTEKTEKSMFDSAKSALDYAYKGFIAAPKKELEIFGSVTADVNIAIAQISVPIKLYQKVIYYEDGDVLVYQAIYEEGNKYGQSSATYRFYTKDGKAYKAETKTVSYDESTGIITGIDMPQTVKYDRDASYYIYNFSKENIKEDISFEPKYNAYTGKIEGYNASANLNVITAVKGYDKQCEEELELSSQALFDKLEVHALLSSKGDIQSLVVYEKYHSTKVVGFDVPYTSSSKLQISFNFDFDEYSIQKPQIDAIN